MTRIAPLKTPDPTRKLHIATDASKVGVGAVLYQPTREQEKENDDSITANNIVLIASRALNKHEKVYPAFKLELLAITYALHEFHEYVYGQKFELHTDHKPLVYVLGLGITDRLNSSVATRQPIALI